jgi:hypothetical protein
MELLHYKESGDLKEHFKCCNKNIKFYDSISCNENIESCLMICEICKKKYYQEITLGKQYHNIVNSKKTGYPHYSTFTLPEKLK